MLMKHFSYVNGMFATAFGRVQYEAEYPRYSVTSTNIWNPSPRLMVFQDLNTLIFSCKPSEVAGQCYN
jgi:hypothetical protein